MRTITAAGVQQLLAQETGHVFVYLIEINHASLGVPLRYAANLEDIPLNGDTYTAFPFKIALPDDDSENIPEVRLILDNVGQDLINTIRSIADPLTVDLSVVRLDTANVPTLEIGPLNFNLNSVKYNEYTIEAVLGYESDYLNALATSYFLDPTLAPALF